MVRLLRGTYGNVDDVAIDAGAVRGVVLQPLISKLLTFTCLISGLSRLILKPLAS